MTMSSEVVKSAEDKFVTAGRGAETFAEATIDILGAVSISSLKWGLAFPLEDWAMITRGIVRGAMELGADLESVGRGLMIGGIRRALSQGTERMETIKMIAGIALEETIAMGGDVEGMASGLAAGACEGSVELGISEQTVIRAAADGASAGVRKIGSTFEQLVDSARHRMCAVAA